MDADKKMPYLNSSVSIGPHLTSESSVEPWQYRIFLRFLRGEYNRSMTQTPRTSAIVLASGGLDSTTCLAIARAEWFSPIYSLSFDYGQRHRQELAAAAAVAEQIGVAEHRIMTIDLRQFGKSALTDSIAVPKDRDESTMAGEIPITYVPARNTIFLSYALAWAEVLGVRDIFIGVNAVDYSGYPDCRPAFIEAFSIMANLATKMTTEPGPALRIHAPLIHLTKSQIIRRGTDLGVDYSLTHSCYDPDSEGRACGRCDSCVLRRKGFIEAGVADPTRYQLA
jgi:7-cyano-7-deazaguanine synthase